MKIALSPRYSCNILSALLLGSVLTPNTVIAQQGSGDGAVGSQRSDEGAVDAFLERKRSEQQNRETALGRRSANAEIAQLKALYRAATIAAPSANGKISAAKLTMLSESLETDSLQLLRALNFNPGKIQQMIRSGANPLLAASNFIRGNSSLDEQALLADITMVARVVSIVNERSGDGFRSTVMLQPIEVLAGRAPKGNVALRQASGLDGDGSTIDVSTDIQPAVGNTFLLMLSSALYAQTVEEGGSKPARKPIDAHILFGSAYQVDGDKLTAVNLGSSPDVSLTQFRSSIANAKNVKATTP